MGDFNKAYLRLLNYEGLYSKIVIDKGGETYKGISRVYNPNWKGWEIIDRYKNENKLNELGKDVQLEILVQQFYKREYWDYYKCEILVQEIAEEIFEASVNIGKPRYNIILRTVLNLLNRNGKLYNDIPVNNSFDEQVFKTLLICIEKNGLRLVYNVLNYFQARHYINLMLADRNNEAFIGWFNRIEIINI